MAKKITVKIGRNAATGQFTTVKSALKQPKGHVVETIKRVAKASAITAAPSVPPPPPKKK